MTGTWLTQGDLTYILFKWWLLPGEVWGASPMSPTDKPRIIHMMVTTVFQDAVRKEQAPVHKHLSRHCLQYVSYLLLDKQVTWPGPWTACTGTTQRNKIGKEEQNGDLTPTT